MKNYYFLCLIIFTVMANSCNQPASENPEKWNDEKISEWYRSGEWKSGWNIMPDESINKRELAIQYHKNPERWEKAFTFLKTKNLETIEPGIYELEGKDLFINVSEYITKNEDDTKFEAHIEYIDIQYVVSGEERIGVLPLEKTKEIIPYDSSKDIAFQTAENSNYRFATPERFFIFFPEDAHRPGVKSDNNSNVRKVVVKIKID